MVGQVQTIQAIEPQGDYPLIEDVVGGEVADLIYQTWDGRFGDILDYGGGSYAITVQMLEEVTAEALAEATGLRAEIAAQVLDVCHRAVAELP